MSPLQKYYKFFYLKFSVPSSTILILSVGSCPFLFLSETFFSNISVPFHVVSAPVILIHDFFNLPGTGRAENLHQQHARETIYPIASCCPVITDPNDMNTHYCQGTYFQKWWFLFKNITRVHVGGCSLKSKGPTWLFLEASPSCIFPFHMFYALWVIMIQYFLNFTQ